MTSSRYAVGVMGTTAFECIDHVGIAVVDLDAATAMYTQLLGRAPSHREVVAKDGVETVMFELGESRVELLGATGADSAIAKFLAKRGEGLHHVAYRVPDVATALAECDEAGYELLDTTPRPGSGHRMVAFVHPRSVHGVLTELCQKMSE